MDSDTADELQILRLRAYGPSADIHTDSTAQQRLRELEGLVRVPAPLPRDTSATVDDTHADRGHEPAAEADVPPRVSAHDTTSAPDPDRTRTSGHDEPGATPKAAEDGRPRRRRLSRHVRLLWAGSILAAAGIAAAGTYGLVAMTPVSASSGAPQIATLRPTPLVEVPPGWFGAGPSSRVWEFQGLTLFETSSGMFGNANGGECFAVVTTEEIPKAEESNQDSWSLSGQIYSACRVGVFPATVQLIVDSNAPEELRTAYPDSAIQFVRQGDQIGVFLDEG